ncbi:MAG: protein kinase [Deltaproteobacteria bacterium]
MTRAHHTNVSPCLPGLDLPSGLASTALPSSCLTTDEHLLLVLGELPDARRATALEHVDVCLDCQLLLAGAAQALRDSGDAPQRSTGGVFAVGERVANRYRVDRFIARGGMGEIYAVHDSVLNDAVALKTVRGASPNDEKAIRRLKSEAQLSRKIGHPHTCRIYEFGEHELAQGGIVYFFTMALVEGETLGVKLRRDGPLRPELVATIARQILGGLAEAHSLGVLHRDLKSDNIMLRSRPGVGLAVDAVIMDFGLALQLDSDDRLTSDSHALVGSAAYMAPEQVEGEKLTPAADLYACGVILFEMLTGQLPFRARTLAATAMKRLRHVAPVPSSVNRAIDPSWDAIVLGCLERSLDQRFASARDVLAALDARETRQAKGPHESRPARVAALVLGALVLALAALLIPWSPAGLASKPAKPATPALSEVASSAALVPSPAPIPIELVVEALEPGSGAQPPRSKRLPAPVRRGPAQSKQGPARAPLAAASMPQVPAALEEPRSAPIGPLPIDAEFPH